MPPPRLRRWRGGGTARGRKRRGEGAASCGGGQRSQARGQVFAALTAEWKEMGILPTASAYVVGPEVEGKTIVEAHYRRAWEGALLEIFEQRDEAEAWIARALAVTS